MAKTGILWRDLPKSYGNSNAVFKRFNRRSRKGRWQAIFAIIADSDRIATRYDKLLNNFLSFVFLAAAVLNTK